jgi:hypothetical protein
LAEVFWLKNDKICTEFVSGAVKPSGKTTDGALKYAFDKTLSNAFFLVLHFAKGNEMRNEVK